MKSILPILLAAVVATSIALLSPLYPVYAQTDVPAPSVKRIARPAAASAAAKLDAAKEKLEEKRETAVARVDTMLEKVSTRSAELKAKLARFRDKTKATKVENINTNLNSVNLKHTTQMAGSLNRISNVLAKLKTWVAQQETAGKDVADLKSAITETETAWTLADGAIKIQAEKDYTIVVNTESTVKADAQTARNALHTDLKATHDKLVDVKQTLSTALSSWNGGDK